MTRKSSTKKFFLNIYKTHKKELIVIMVIAVIGSALTSSIPYIYGRLFDLALIPNTTVTLLLSLVGLWAVLGLISNFISAKTYALGDILGCKTSLESEVESYSHFLTLPITYYKTKKTGGILQKIARSSWYLQDFIQTISNILPSVVFLIFALIAMSIIQWQLGLIVFFTFVLYSIATLKLMKPVIKSQDKMQEAFEREYGNIYDKLYNVFLVKNFTMEEKEKGTIFRLLGNMVAPLRNNIEKTARLQHIQGIIYNLSFVVVLGSAIFFLRAGQITQGEFIMFFGYIDLSFSPFFKLNNVYKSYKGTTIAIKRLVRFRNLVPEATKHGNETIKEFTGEINFKNVSFKFNSNKEILRNINLKINSGESVAFVGESGVGKTTLSELVLGYYKLTKGVVFLDGINILKLKLKWIREQIAIVPQEISIFNDTIINNIKYANPKANFKDVVSATKAANAHEFIMSLPKKYKTIVGERGIKLSVGQKQRVAIAMAFLRNPKILIMDEPTSALDSKSERDVQEGVKKLIPGRTTIIIAHRFSTVKNVDKIVVLDSGKIVEVGNHQDLIKNRGKYYELYSLQRGLD